MTRRPGIRLNLQYNISRQPSGNLAGSKPRCAVLAVGLRPCITRRNWLLLCESLNISHPTLLPFGITLHARQRFKTGRDAQRRRRTIEGRYLGQAPDTPGGHLVLVSDDSGQQKVLLTNTVYPLRDTPGNPTNPSTVYGVRCLLSLHSAWCSKTFPRPLKTPKTLSKTFQKTSQSPLQATKNLFKTSVSKPSQVLSETFPKPFKTSSS